MVEHSSFTHNKELHQTFYKGNNALRNPRSSISKEKSNSSPFKKQKSPLLKDNPNGMNLKEESDVLSATIHQTIEDINVGCNLPN